MEKTFREFFETCKKSIEYDPWASKRGTAGYIEELQNELDEVKEAWEKDDMENFSEELGDVLLDWIHVVLSAEKEGLVDPKKVLEDIHTKLNRRKPYLKEERYVTLDEAREIWRNVKKKEKEQLALSQKSTI